MSKRIHKKSVPNHIARIVSKYGINKAADDLGITMTAVKKYIKDNKAPYATELAAQLLFEKNSDHLSKTALIKFDPNMLPLLEKMGTLTIIQ